MEEILRAIAEKTLSSPPTRIVRDGFGTVRVTRRTGQGVITEQIQRAYEAGPCRCHVVEINELGSPCPLCFQILLEAQRLKRMPIEFTLAEISFLARPCSKHSQVCQFPCCGQAVCPQHGTFADDNRFYCLPHHKEIQEAIRREKLKQAHGAIGAGVSEFLRSLIFRDDP